MGTTVGGRELKGWRRFREAFVRRGCALCSAWRVFAFYTAAILLVGLAAVLVGRTLTFFAGP